MSEYTPTKEGAVVQALFPVLNKAGEVKQFEFNWAQQSLDANWSSRNLIPKARQLGVSTFVLARWTAACLMRQNINAVVVSHESNATQRLLQKVHFFLDNMSGPPPKVKKSRNRIEFLRTGSTFFIGTAGSDTFGRGDTIHLLHCSEYAFWESGAKLLMGMLASVPPVGSEVAIESTGNGHNDYAQRCLRAAAQGGKGYTLHFLNWLAEPTYRLNMAEADTAEFMASLDVDLNEPELAKILSPEQLAFRRNKILEEYNGDLIMFNQEYPITLDECFQASGHSVFWKVNYDQSSEWQQRDRQAWGLAKHPKRGCVYVVGADPSGGTGKDCAVAEVFCIDTNEQVYEWRDDRTPPDMFAFRLREIGQMFNDALIVCENNNHGILTLSKLGELYRPERIYYGKHGRAKEEVPNILQAGFRTTEQSKPLAIGRLRERVSQDTKIYSPILRDEMKTFIEDDNGKMHAEEGYFDDCVMACSMAMMGWNDAEFLCREPDIQLDTGGPDPWTLEGILERREQSQHGFPLAAQHEVIH